MPDLTSTAATFRGGRYRYTGFISTVPQTVIFSRAVNMASISYPLKAITYDDPYSGVGAFGDVLEDLTVIVYSGNTTTEKGRLRVASGAASSTVLQVSEFAKGVIDLADNDRFDVVKEWRVWDRLVEAAAALRKDSRLTYTDQGSNPGPVVASGGPIVGFISGSTLSANFYGSNSYVVDPDSAGTVTHAWSFGDGTPSSSTAANPAGVTFPAGFRWITHTVTDSGNSKSTTQRVPVWAHERTGANAPLSVQMESRSYQNGYWTARFRLPKESQSSVTTLPDGALIVYWEEEYYGTTQASYGLNVSDRSHIKFVGYLLRDTLTIDADRNEVVFEAVGPLGILEQTPALPQLILSKTAPANWQQVKSLTVNRILWYLLHWGATADVAHDFIWFSGTDLSYARIAIDNIDSIAGQLRDVAASINVLLTCDRLGRLLLIRDPNYMNSSDRSARTTVYNLTTADVRNLDVTREHRGSYKFVRGEGIIAGSTTAALKPVFSNAPGNAPAPFAVGTETLSKQIVASQTELNNRTGWHFARVNALRNGLFVPRGARALFRGAYDWLEPAYLEWLTLTLASTTNKRGVSYSTSTRWVAESMDVSYDPELGLKEVSAVISHETDGAAGATYTPPAANNVGSFSLPEFNFDFGTYTPSFPVTGLRQGLQTVAAFVSDNTLQITTDFETPEASGGPAWVETDLTALSGWPGGTLCQFEVDAFSPKYLGTGSTVNGWIRTTTHVMRITDIFGTPALTGVVALRATASANKTSMRFERGLQNWGIVTTWYDADGVWAARTITGTSWTEIQVGAHYDTNFATLGSPPGIFLNPHNAGEAYTSRYTATGTYPAAELVRTTDHGATWSTFSPSTNLGNLIANCIVVPYQATDFETLYYPHTTGSGTFDPRLYRTNNSGTTDISPVISGAQYAPHSFTRAFSVCDNDRNTGMLCGIREYIGGDPRLVAISRNLEAAAPTWTALQGPDAAINYREVYAAAANRFYLIGESAAIGFSDGLTVDSRQGNITGNTTGRICGICGN